MFNKKMCLLHIPKVEPSWLDCTDTLHSVEFCTRNYYSLALELSNFSARKDSYESLGLKGYQTSQS